MAGDRMITPREALDLVRRHCRPLPVATLSLEASLGCVLAENVRTPFPMPRFDNTAMDGYAIRSRDTRNAGNNHPVQLKLVDTVYAGQPSERLGRREACAIMTGGRMPAGADAVIPVEDAVVEVGYLIVRRPVEKFRHVRRRGEETRSGARVLDRGAAVHPGVIALLAAMGRDEIRVVRPPRVAVITTGDETVAPGSDPDETQIFDSNSPMIVAMLRETGIEPVLVKHSGDRRGALRRVVRTALDQSDILITTGGVSMGEHDHLRPIFRELNVKEVFWRVSQKPGKPLYFGRQGTRRVFGLPGNPASAFVCFYAYVYTALRRMGGHVDTDTLAQERLAVDTPIPGDGKRWQLLRGRSSGAGVSVVPGQGSHMVTALAHADRLILVPPGDGRMKRGERVTTMRLPHVEEAAR